MYMHRVVIPRSTKRSESSEKGNRLRAVIDGEFKVLTGELWDDWETSIQSVSGTSHERRGEDADE